VFTPLTITGAEAPKGSPAVLDANGATPLIIGSGMNVTIDDLTITGGYDNSNGIGTGVVNNGGTVSINNSTIADNTGGNDGGGIANNSGSLTLTNSTVSGNKADTNGGGIYNDGTLTVVNSTIANNQAENNAGGIFNDTSGTGTITSSTIASNSAFTAGGINYGTALSVGSTIIAGNSSSNSTNNCESPVTSVGYNLTDDDGTDCGFTQPTDVVNSDPGLGTLSNNGGPTETMLPSNTGPAIGVIPTDTTLNGVEVCPGTDQRGIARPEPTGASDCSIGAAEVGPPAAATFNSQGGTTFTVGNPGAFTVDTYASPDAALTESGSLPNGVTFTDNGDGTATIQGTPAAGSRGTYPLTISAQNNQGTTTQSFNLFVAQNLATYYVAQGGSDSANCSSAHPCATITQALTDAGPGDTIQVSGTVSDNVSVQFPITITGSAAPAASPAVVEAASSGSVFTVVNAGNTVNIDDLSIENGNYQFGAGVYNDADANLSGVTLSNNQAAFAGGAVLNQGTMSVSDSTLTGNTGTYAAGAIDNDGTLTVSDSTLSDNSSPGAGGAIANGGSLTLLFDTITGNSASASEGGGIASGGTGTTTIAGTIVTNNTGGNCVGAGTADGGYNLTDDSGTDCGFTASTDLLNADPELAPLALNGGPTQTMVLPVDSPEANAIPTSATAEINGQNVTLCSGTDQRGVTRAVASGTACDIGAVELALSVTKLTGSPTKSTYGQAVTLTATISEVASTPKLPTPAGTVDFYSSYPGSPISGCLNVPVSAAGTAGCTTASIPAGSTQLIAIYSGTNGYIGIYSGAGGLTFKVASSPTSVGVTATEKKVVDNKPATFWATVFADAPGAGIPTGTVTFQLAGAAIAGCRNLPLNPSGDVSCTKTFKTTKGAQTITANYKSSTSDYKASTGTLKIRFVS
jgi:hypothetical protein